jgi:hypothetical protein
VAPDFGGLAVLAGGSVEVLDVLGCDGFGDGGVHGSFLSSWSTLESTAMRMS